MLCSDHEQLLLVVIQKVALRFVSANLQKKCSMTFNNKGKAHAVVLQMLSSGCHVPEPNVYYEMRTFTVCGAASQ
jgi:16S rRNA A1518/A1519 N6-dimethyltransferase RsmA/KsgA/DIM1 with predicted DNA glycosylase/AP lyase activity